MFPVNKKNAQAGFSLVELMVVVAIIGILAAIAIPNMQKYMAKSRQSEAKTNLAAIYTSQKAVFAEYNGYYGGLQTIGFSPEGRMRYNTGFTALGTLPAGLTAATPNNPNTVTLCAAAGSTCSILPGVNGTAPGNIAGAATSATAFNARARAYIASATRFDQWEITETKILSNQTNGL